MTHRVVYTYARLARSMLVWRAGRAGYHLPDGQNGPREGLYAIPLGTLRYMDGGTLPLYPARVWPT